MKKMENQKITDRPDKGLLAGNGTWKKIFSKVPNVVDDLAREANQLFDYSAGKNARTIAIEQNRIKNPFWRNTRLFEQMHYLTTTPPQPQKQAGMTDPNAFKFVLLLGITGFVVYKLLPKKPQQKINE